MKKSKGYLVKTINVLPEQWEFLQRMAETKGMHVAEVVRQMIDRYQRQVAKIDRERTKAS